jgi:uncharacterized membrane protein YoaK (UPF0700 family)
MHIRSVPLFFFAMLNSMSTVVCRRLVVIVDPPLCVCVLMCACVPEALASIPLKKYLEISPYFFVKVTM